MLPDPPPSTPLDHLQALPRGASVQEPLSFLLNHPRRCYTLLFPSGLTWALAGILALLNLADALLIVVLDLDNPSVSNLPGGGASRRPCFKLLVLGIRGPRRLTLQR